MLYRVVTLGLRTRFLQKKGIGTGTGTGTEMDVQKDCMQHSFYIHIYLRPQYTSRSSRSCQFPKLLSEANFFIFIIIISFQATTHLHLKPKSPQPREPPPRPNPDTALQ